MADNILCRSYVIKILIKKIGDRRRRGGGEAELLVSYGTANDADRIKCENYKNYNVYFLIRYNLRKKKKSKIFYVNYEKYGISQDSSFALPLKNSS